MPSDGGRNYAELLAYLDGTLDVQTADSLRRRLARSPELQADLEWIETVAADLGAMADQTARHLPEIDLVDPVMQAVRRATQPELIEHACTRPGTRRIPRLFWAGVAAAAAALLMVLAHVLFGSTEPPPDTPRFSEGPESPGTPGGLEEVPGPPEAPGAQPPGRVDRRPDRQLAEEDFEIEGVGAPDSSALTPGDIVTARRKAALDKSAWGQLHRWATLPENDARRIASSPDASPEAVAGAAASLSAGERQTALLTVVGRLGAAPAARLALARAYDEGPQNAPESAAQLAELRSLDPDNALPYYIEAKLLMDRGDFDGALALLQQAKELGTASAYALEAALYREQALIANGMQPETARLLTAMTGGDEEYDFLCDLGDDLLEYARYFVDSGDPQTAGDILRSVQQLGRQLNEGASFVDEKLAGADIELAAIDFLTEVYDALGSVEGVEALGARAVDLIGNLGSVEAFVRVVEELFAANEDLALWLSFADMLLRGGDVPLLNLFTQGDLDLLQLLQPPE